MSTGDDFDDQLRVLELKLLSPEVRASAEELRNLLAEDFLEFGGSGRVFDRESIIDSLTSGGPMPQPRFSVEGLSVTRLCDDVALVTYRILGWSDSGEKIRESLRSSIWAFRQERWQMIFHQGTRKL